MEKKILLSISLLASNRLDTIPRCLDSLKPILEAIPSELVIVDTSGSEEVHTVLKSYTEHVIKFDWCNDFAKARNAGLERCRGEWFFYLDDDEWLVEYDELISFFTSQEHRLYDCANYYQRNFLDNALTTYKDAVVSRVIKRKEGVCFKGKIHEYLIPTDGKCKNFDFKVYHTGYLYQTKEKAEQHFQRNSVLLQEMMDLEPYELRWKTQLAQEYRSIGRWQELEKHCKESLAFHSDRDDTKDKLLPLKIMSLYAGYMLALNKQDKLEELLKVSRTLLEDEFCVKMAVAMCYSNLAESYYRRNNFEVVEWYCKEFFKVLDMLQENPEQIKLESAVQILGDTANENNIKRIKDIMTKCSNQETKEKDILLSISLLASNRLDTIPRCLDSLKPILEAIPSELVIVDTSESEEVHSLLKTYTENVVKFKWCNDFSKARNTGLELCQGEWFMFIDDDEWFVEPEALIEFFTSGEYKEYGAADYRVRNFVDKGNHFHETWVSRLVKLGKETKFHSKVHEYLAPYDGGIKPIDALVYHSGYVYNTSEEKEAHFQRNIKLLYKMEEEEPENLRWKIQIINEYRSADKWEGAKEYGEKALKYLTTGTHKIHKIAFIEIILGYLSALLKLEEYETMEKISLYARGLLSDNMPMSKGYLDFFSAMASFHLKKYDEAEQYIKAYWDVYEKYSKNAEVGNDEERNLIVTEAFLKTKRNTMKLTEELINLIKSKDMDFDAWREKLVSLMKEVNMDVIDTLKEHLEESEFAQDIRFGYFMIIYAEQKLCRGVEDEFTREDYEEWFSTFSIYTQKTYEAMYGDALNQVEVEELPTNYQAAMWIQLYTEELGTDLSSAFACIKKLVEVYPMFAEPVKCYLSMMKSSLS